MTAFRLDEPRDLDARDLNQQEAVTFACEREQDAEAVQALVADAFGPGRLAKFSERLREGNRLRRDLSICAWSGGRLVGTVRQWPLLVGETSGVFLGPFAVDAVFRSRGLGASLILKACDAAGEAGEPFTLLVGAPAFFTPLNFEAVPSRVVMPGPVDRRRVLWRAHTPDGVAGVEGVARVPRSPST